MKEVLLTASNICKHFYTIQQRKTALSVLTNFLSGKGVRSKLQVLSDISLEINKGDKVALIGKNAAGKTTLIRIMCGIYRPSSGELRLASNPRPLFRSLVGLAGELFVEENVRLCSAIHGLSQPLSDSLLEEILETADLLKSRYRKLNELSLGQRERLMMSVFFKVTDEFLIFDEMFSVVDNVFKHRYIQYFQSLSESNKTVIIASHDCDFLATVCKKAIWLENGRILRVGSFNEIASEYNRVRA